MKRNEGEGFTGKGKRLSPINYGLSTIYGYLRPSAKSAVNLRCVLRVLGVRQEFRFVLDLGFQEGVVENSAVASNEF